MYLVTLMIYENTESCNSMKSVVQGDLRGNINIFGGNSLCHCKKKSLYECCLILNGY
jgi:hypothetical protein